MRSAALYARLRRGEVANVSFDDALRLCRWLGFDLLRVSGGHHVLGHPAVAELVNLQNIAGQAKPYQLRQLIALTRRYPEVFQEEP